MYIHQHPNWNLFRYDSDKFVSLLANVRNLQGRLLGQMVNLGFTLREDAMLTTLTLDILKSSEIEGELLDKEQVRSSIARRLGFTTTNMVKSTRNIDGIVEMMLDATQNYDQELTQERLFGWHAALFPTGWSGMYQIEVGHYRTGEMQVVSGAMGMERVHYEAPKPESVPTEMAEFLKWVNCDNGIDQVLKSAIAHFWFITIHPFDDGNGRIARTIADMFLAKSDNNTQRFYSMSNQILTERKKYYQILEETQHGSGDLTAWIVWYLQCLKQSLETTGTILQSILQKAHFWETNRETELNQRQKLMLNKLLDGLDGNLTTAKWSKIAKCSQDTALRDIQDLIKKQILTKQGENKRTTTYQIQ